MHQNYRFRPLAGDLSSLRSENESKNGAAVRVSVPLQGTYLPYSGLLNVHWEHDMESFRPLAGDLSSLRSTWDIDLSTEFVSVPLQGTYLPYPVRAIHEFPYVSTALCVRKRK